MFLFRRFNKLILIIPCFIFLPSLLILKNYFYQNDKYQFTEINNNQILINRNSEILEHITNSKRNHLINSQSNLIQFSNRPFVLYIHLDLKGAAPKISYFKNLFPLLHQWGVTGICIEYEDMFPFDGILQIIQNKQAYTKNDIKKINQLAKDNQLDVMPLLQTYGHLEFLLKLKEFSYLRENPRYPQVITPCLNETYSILYSMIDQYLNLHPDIHYFHIGHDEVYYFLTNSACEQFKHLAGIETQYDLFAYHLNLIANYIKQKYPNIILFIWHDVLQNLNLQILEKYNLIHLINPVLWSYREDISVEGFFNSPQAELFRQYKTLWGATAFKGATDEIATTSDIKHYYENQVSWIKQLHRYIPTKWKNFHGMILTGWSRYDHFLSLCELLPYSIPSMLFSISAWHKKFESLPNINISPNRLHEYVKQQLNCSSSIHLTIQEHLTKSLPNCQFPGSDIYELIISLSRIWIQVDEVELFVNKYVTNLHIKYNYIHIKRGEECLEKLIPIIEILKKFRRLFIQAMNKIFPEHVAIEWLETYFMKRYHLIYQRYQFIQRAINEQKSWLPRPIPNIDKLQMNK